MNFDDDVKARISEDDLREIEHICRLESEDPVEPELGPRYSSVSQFLRAASRNERRRYIADRLRLGKKQ